MRKVLLVQYNSKLLGYDDYQSVLQTITDWEEVDEETYQELIRCQDEGRYILFTPLTKQETQSTIANVLAKAKKLKEQREKTREEYQKRQKDREAKALQRKIAGAKKLLEQHGSE